MRRLVIAGVVTLAACGGGQTTVEPCVRRLDLLGGVAQMNSGDTRAVEAKQSSKSGQCTGKEKVSFLSTNALVADFPTMTDSTAVVRARGAGVTNIVGFLTLFPSVRDSFSVQVIAPRDTMVRDTSKN